MREAWEKKGGNTGRWRPDVRKTRVRVEVKAHILCRPRAMSSETRSCSSLAHPQGVRKESQRFASQDGAPKKGPEGVKDKAHLAGRKSVLAVGLILAGA